MGIRLSGAILAALAALACFCALALPAGAQNLESTVRDDPTGRESEGDRLFRYLGQASSETEGRAMEREIWRYWLEAPDAEAAALMNEALKRRGEYDLAGAHDVLDRLVREYPGWAEAWNQRATIRFMQGQLNASLDDIERVVELEPRHFGALAGQAIILMHQGRFQAAQSILKRAVDIHPFLRERSMIVDRPAAGEERRI